MKNEVAQDLNLLLADYQVLYQKLRGYHWNVRGPLFFELHKRFEELYEEAAERVDALAERVLALGGRPVHTLQEQLALARLREDPSTPSPQEMARNLAEDLERLEREIGSVIDRAGRAGDATTATFLQEIVDRQAKTSWMLRAFLAA